MPSKINHEINVLRGESEDTGEVFTSSMATLQATIDDMALSIKSLESEQLALKRKESLSSNIANKALSIANSSVKKSGDPVIASDFSIGDPTQIIINSGIITISQAYHKIYPQDASSDDLVTISGGYDGRILILVFYPPSTITIKNGTGNIHCGADKSCPGLQKSIMSLVYNTDLGGWIMIGFQDNL